MSAIQNSVHKLKNVFLLSCQFLFVIRTTGHAPVHFNNVQHNYPGWQSQLRHSGPLIYPPLNPAIIHPYSAHNQIHQHIPQHPQFVNTVQNNYIPPAALQPQPVNPYQNQLNPIPNYPPQPILLPTSQQFQTNYISPSYSNNQIQPQVGPQQSQLIPVQSHSAVEILPSYSYQHNYYNPPIQTGITPVTPESSTLQHNFNSLPLNGHSEQQQQQIQPEQQQQETQQQESQTDQHSNSASQNLYSIPQSTQYLPFQDNPGQQQQPDSSNPVYNGQGGQNENNYNPQNYIAEPTPNSYTPQNEFDHNNAQSQFQEQQITRSDNYLTYYAPRPTKKPRTSNTRTNYYNNYYDYHGTGFSIPTPPPVQPYKNTKGHNKNNNKEQTKFNYNYNDDKDEGKSLAGNMAIALPVKNMTLSTEQGPPDQEIKGSSRSTTKVPGGWGMDPYIAPIVKINLGQFMDKFNSMCSYYLPSMEFGRICEKKMRHGYPVDGA